MNNIAVVAEAPAQQAAIEAVSQAVKAYRAASTERIEAALNGGRALLTLKKQLPHGSFLPMLATLELSERTARNWMALASAGLEIGNVADLGLTRSYRAARILNGGKVTGRGLDALEVRQDIIRIKTDHVKRLEQRHGKLLAENRKLRRQLKARRAEIDRVTARIEAYA